MRVTFNTSYRNANDSIAAAAEESVVRQRQVATGKRLATVSDDPAAVSASVTEHGDLAAISQYRRAADTVSSRLSVLDTVVSNLVDLTTSAKVAAQSGRGSVSDAQREAAANNVRSIRDSMFSTVTTQYRGNYLLSGSDSTTAPYTKTGDVISGYNGSATITQVDVDQQTSVGIVMDGNALLQGSDSEDLFTVLDNLATALESADETAIESGMASLDSAFGRINRALGRIGTDINLVESQDTRLAAKQLASKTRLASLENIDLAEAISAMKQADTAYNAALSAVSSTSGLSLFDYLK